MFAGYVFSALAILGYHTCVRAAPARLTTRLLQNFTIPDNDLFAIAFDTETHDWGAYKGKAIQGRVVQLGWVEYTRSGEFQGVSFVIDPRTGPKPYKIAQKAEKYHGITNVYACANGVVMADVIDVFEQRIALLKKNNGFLNFDLDAVRNEYRINDVSFGEVDSTNQIDTIDTKYLKALGRDVVGDFRRKRLGVLFGILCNHHPRYEERVNNAHDALADSDMCGLIFFEFLSRGFIEPVSETSGKISGAKRNIDQISQLNKRSLSDGDVPSGDDDDTRNQKRPISDISSIEDEDSSTVTSLEDNSSSESVFENEPSVDRFPSSSSLIVPDDENFEQMSSSTNPKEVQYEADSENSDDSSESGESSVESDDEDAESNTQSGSEESSHDSVSEGSCAQSIECVFDAASVENGPVPAPAFASFDMNTDDDSQAYVHNNPQEGHTPYKHIASADDETVSEEEWARYLEWMRIPKLI